MKFHGKRRRHLIEISYSSQYHVRKKLKTVTLQAKKRATPCCFGGTSP
jgi:hypothetical protein